MTKIKICGITNLKDALNAVKCGADAIGFVFAPGKRKITPTEAVLITKRIAPFINCVGVFVNAPKKEVLKIIRNCRIDTLQFHGEEDNKYCAFFQKYCKIIKAFRIKNSSSLKKIKTYKNVDSYLFDTFEKNKSGGTGNTFDQNILKNKKFGKPIIISGGLNSSNVSKTIRALTPYGVDVSSSIEYKPGKKSARLMSEFVKSVKTNERY